MVENPYEPPVTRDAVPDTAKAAGWLKLASSWTFVFAANLPLPILFASSMAKGAAVAGVIAVSCSFWLLGLYCSYQAPGLLRIFSRGGIAVAVSQLVPILHVFAGAAAFEIVRAISGRRPDDNLPLLNIEQFWEGALTTLVSGGILLIAAGLCGAVITLGIRAWKASSRQRSTS